MTQEVSPEAMADELLSRFAIFHRHGDIRLVRGVEEPEPASGAPMFDVPVGKTELVQAIKAAERRSGFDGR
jgi:hypothetical protein